MKSKNSLQKKNNRFSVKTLCAAALLAAMAVVLSLVCKSLTITMSIRLTFENLPIILSGYLFGPFAGILTGLCTDLVSTSVTYGIGGINPILTVGAASVGFISGIISHYILTKKSALQLIVCVFASHIIANMGIKTLGLFIYYHTPPVEIFTRILLYLGIATIESVLLVIILKSKGINKAIGALKQ